MPLSMPIDEIRRAMRARLMSRLEEGVREGANDICTVLKEVVSGSASGGHPLGPARVTPYVYMEPSGKVRRRSRDYTPPSGRPEPSTRMRLGPPGLDSTAGRESIKFEITERDAERGRIVVMIGVDNSAPGGMRQLRSYMMGHEMGIAYPTRGRAPRRIIQHPWLRVTVHRELGNFRTAVINSVRGFN